MGEGGRARGGEVAGLGLTVLWIAALLVEQRAPTPQVDDAYIAYRYATNALAGHGPVFNPGEWVEGFTSPLFTLAVALGVAGGAPATAVGHVLGLLGAAGAMLAAFLYARALAPALPGFVAGCAPAVLLASAAFVRWSTGGLETTLFAAGLTAALAAAAAGRVGATTAALVVAALTRPEGALVAALLYGVWLLGPRRAAAARGALVFAAFGAALLVVRFALYGELLPNTFHAKVGGVPLSFGLAYLGAFLADGAAWLLPGAVGAAWLLPAARPGAGVVAVFALYVVAVGGDLLGESRFLVPLLPALAALAVVGAGAAWERSRVAGGVAIAATLLAPVWLVAGPGPAGEGLKRSRVLDVARRTDRFFEAAGERRAALLRERGERDVSVATGAIGSFGFHAGPDVRVIDILGLTDAHIARAPLGDDAARWPGHLRSDAAYVLARQPDWLMIRRRGSPGAGRLRAVAELWERPELERDYAWDASLGAYRRRPGQRPNLLLIVVDTLRADRLGSYGAERDTSPALDRLAASGVRFQRAYATAPWTKPAVASIFTGLHPGAHGANRVKATLPQRANTLAETLRDAGYRTAGVVSHDVLSDANGFSQGFERWSEEEAGGHEHVSTAGVTRRAVALLDELSAGDAPFFLFVHYFDPHYDYQRHPEFGFAPERAGRLDGSERLVSLRRIPDLSDEEVGLLRDLYDEEIRFTDAGIGELLGRLEQRGLDVSTVVVATADHGEAFLEHGWLGHTRSLYDVLLRVPLIVRAPGASPRVVEEPVSVVSVLPTVLDLLDQPLPPDLHGASLAPVVRGEAPPAAPLFAEVDFLPVFDPAKRAAKKAILDPPWKLIRDERSGRVELYDLDADPEERHDLAGAEPERVRAMLAQLEGHAARVRRAALPAEAREPTREELLRLEALGYGSP